MARRRGLRANAAPHAPLTHRPQTHSAERRGPAVAPSAPRRQRALRRTDGGLPGDSGPIGVRGRTRRGSVIAAPLDCPAVGLAGDLGDGLEVGVVMQHGQVAALRDSGHEGIHQGDRPVRSLLGEPALDVD